MSNDLFYVPYVWKVFQLFPEAQVKEHVHVHTWLGREK